MRIMHYLSKLHLSELLANRGERFSEICLALRLIAEQVARKYKFLNQDSMQDRIATATLA